MNEKACKCDAGWYTGGGQQMKPYVCGERFCEYCGDCMYCYGDDYCANSPNGKHWVEADDGEETQG